MDLRSRWSCSQKRMDGWNHHHLECHCCCHLPYVSSLSWWLTWLACFAARVCSCWLKESCCWPRGSFTTNFLALADDLVISALFFLLILGALAVALPSPFTFSAFFFQLSFECSFGHEGGWLEDAGGVVSPSEGS